MSKKVTLKSSDSIAFEVEEVVVLQSETIKHLLEKPERMLASILLPDVTANILGKVIEYCTKHVGNSNRKEDLKKWDAEFVNVDPVTLLDLMDAAKNLEIKNLLDLTSHTFSEMSMV
ncbi:hypothetical protein AQUCO_00200133v1 [Aquilegia coerulea]|uniref:SKP1 component POZ domain-containing protein n=1 Tax=Aquilegia coerulea TaxID=218851 RepID=A0A2G5F1M7_AQUCA|nr:hypothetical protein AQUCO_00200133v1 [Aquilegia coerulea]